jgi:hypothetical protein
VELPRLLTKIEALLQKPREGRSVSE